VHKKVLYIYIYIYIYISGKASFSSPEESVLISLDSWDLAEPNHQRYIKPTLVNFRPRITGREKYWGNRLVVEQSVVVKWMSL
jgi:hypothetical protein